MDFKPTAPPLESPKTISDSEATTISSVSAPPVEIPVFQNPVTQVELTLSARSLINRDQITRSDPFCVIFLLDSTTSDEWIEFGRTESILNDLNPEWKTKLLIDYRFEEKQLLTFVVYDKDCIKASLENHDYLGKLECSLGEVVSAPHSKFTRTLKLPAIHDLQSFDSTLTIVSEEIGDCKKFINFQLQCSGLQGTGLKLIGIKSIPVSRNKIFINISKQNEDSSWMLLHRTERVSVGDHGSVTFSPVNLRYRSVCSKGNLERPLRFQLHSMKRSFRGKSSKLIGELVTNFIELEEKLSESDAKQITLNLSPSIDKKNNLMAAKGEDGKVGSVTISNFSIEPRKTFVDYLHDGLNINFAVAIDFTASNGEVTSHASLHYKHGNRDNPYVMTLKIIAEILEDYNSSKQFYAYGFGAKGFPLANRVNHKFPLNFKERNPLCNGIDGIIGAYNRALQRVKLYGPTCFAPVIREVTELAKSRMQEDPNCYFVLLILTDGIVCDPETTRDAIVQASKVPLSIIIVGIGEEDFTAMERFDSDEKLLKDRSKQSATRDIVQFVELRKFVNFKSINPIKSGAKIALARSVLAELPQQVVNWMEL